jgi:hypothetical protein
VRKNPFQFVEPTFGDGFHLKGATGYSQYSDGTKSPHTVYYADQGAVEKALATFLYLEKAGNLRSTTRVPVSNEMAICVDLPDGRRFFAGNQGADIWIKELSSADGRGAGSHESVSWNQWAQQGTFPKTTWFVSKSKKNPVWIRPEGSLRAQRMEAAYDEAYDNPGRAVYAAFAQAAKAKGQTPAQIKSAYAKKKKAEKPVNPVKVTSKVFGEIIDVTKKHIGDPTFLSSAGMMWADPTKMLIKIELASSKYTGWEVDDPKYVAALRAVAKKYKPQGVQMTVAVKNPRN